MHDTMQAMADNNLHRIPILIPQSLRITLEKAAMERRNANGKGRASVSALIVEVLKEKFQRTKKTVSL